ERQPRPVRLCCDPGRRRAGGAPRAAMRCRGSGWMSRMTEELQPSAVVNPADCRILYSSEAHSSLPTQLGAAHYSYRLAEGKFIRLLQAMGFRPEPVPLPPFYGPQRHGASGGAHGMAPIHLIFRSTENIRPIAGCYNI